MKWSEVDKREFYINEDHGYAIKAVEFLEQELINQRESILQILRDRYNDLMSCNKDDNCHELSHIVATCIKDIEYSFAQESKPVSNSDEIYIEDEEYIRLLLNRKAVKRVEELVDKYRDLAYESNPNGYTETLNDDNSVSYWRIAQELFEALDGEQ